MSVIKRKIHTLFHTERIFTKKIEGSFLYNIMPDKMALDLCYYNIFGRRVNWKNPTTFNEKLQWLKLYNRNPLYTTLVDKYAVKEWVANKIGEEYVIPTYGVWDSFNQIDFDRLPNQFVLKTTHSGGSSGVVICRDKASFDFADAKAKLTASLKSNTYLIGREWPYKDVPRRIIAEKYLSDVGELKDYKFFCFNGEPKFFKIDFGRFVHHHANYYDTECKILPFGEESCPPEFDEPISIPSNIEKMFEIARILAYDIPFIRIDLYSFSSIIMFGEMTLFPAGGAGVFRPNSWDYIIGNMIHIK